MSRKRKEAKVRSEGAIAQAKLLYDIGVTKTRMYEGLTKALFETKQTGAFKIFQDGALNHRTDGLLGVPEIDQQLQQRSLESIVIFQGKEIQLQAIFRTLDEKDAGLLASKHLRGRFLLNLIGNQRPVLVNSSVPDPLNYYIYRKLTSRHHLKSALFETSCKDVFVIRGIQLFELTKLAGLQRTDVSRNQLETITVRFILLEYDQDFEKIAQLSPEPVHLLNYANGTFAWERSHGDISRLQRFVYQAQEGKNEIELLKSCIQKPVPVCISDTPGMGKTALLASIAKRIMEFHPTRLVHFFVLREFVEEVEAKENGTIDKKCLINVISEQMSNLDLGKQIVRVLLESGKKEAVELMFDGFDEVLLSQVKPAKTILRIIAQMKSVRLYVATRPHMRDELEKAIGVLGYNMMPFGKDEQIECLTRYWKHKDNNINGKRLVEFAEHCLKALQENMKDSEQNIAGIPLQCILLAEVFEDEAEDEDDEKIFYTLYEAEPQNI